jgi:predicted LPLAT superfamily acyltransferase
VYLLRGDFHHFDVEVVGADHLDAVLQAGRGAFLVGPTWAASKRCARWGKIGAACA